MRKLEVTMSNLLEQGKIFKVFRTAAIKYEIVFQSKGNLLLYMQVSRTLQVTPNVQRFVVTVVIGSCD